MPGAHTFVRISAAEAALVALIAGACAGRAISIATTAIPAARCDASSVELIWARLPAPSERKRLDRWCAGVGPPVVIRRADAHVNVRRIVVVSWNIHVGAGRVRELADALTKRDAMSPNANTGIVFLLQEAFRTGDSIPEYVPNAMEGPGAQRPTRFDGDVLDLARSTGLSLAYVPSMRNGRGSSVGEREDRGSAVLSSEPLSDITAIELPFGHQRRVAVMATVDPAGDAPSFRVISAHFDVVRGARSQADRLANFVSSNLAGPPFIVGIDTNAVFGRRSPTVGVIDRSVQLVAQCGGGRTNRWLARIDFIFSSLAATHIARCETLPDRYGSDHAPIVLDLDF